MTNDEAAAQYLKQLTSDDADVRTEFMSHYARQVETFAKDMGAAYVNWLKLDGTIEGNEGRAYVVALAYSAITLNTMSMKLFLSGHAVAAGNLYRQTVEAMALSLLCSVGRRLRFLKDFMAEKYSTNDAVRDMLRNTKTLGLNENAKVLKEVQQFNHKYSHPSHFTIGHAMALGEGGIYVGSAFDPKKREFYDKEIASRCGCASVFDNFIDGVRANVAKWPGTARDF